MVLSALALSSISFAFCLVIVVHILAYLSSSRTSSFSCHISMRFDLLVEGERVRRVEVVYREGKQ